MVGELGPRSRLGTLHPYDPYHPAQLLQRALELQYTNASNGVAFRLALRSLVNTTIGFEELARRTGMNSKSLHRMLSKDGNPTSKNIAVIIRGLLDALDLAVNIRVELRESTDATVVDYAPARQAARSTDL